MSKATLLRKERLQILDKLEQKFGGRDGGPFIPILYLTIATVVCLIGATIPQHMATYKLFAQTSLLCLTLLAITIITSRKHLAVKQLKRTAAIIGITMALTGCSGLFVPDFSKTTPLIEYLHEADREYKTGHAGGIALFGFGFGFGFGLDDATVETAMTNGNIAKAYAVETNSSFGWIAVARVKVYGE
jgi:hypothetical protein